MTPEPETRKLTSRRLIEARFSEDLPRFTHTEVLKTLDVEIQKTLRRLLLNAYAAGYLRHEEEALRETQQPTA